MKTGERAGHGILTDREKRIAADALRLDGCEVLAKVVSTISPTTEINFNTRSDRRTEGELILGGLAKLAEVRWHPIKRFRARAMLNSARELGLGTADS
jgi:hypothetical protein